MPCRAFHCVSGIHNLTPCILVLDRVSLCLPIHMLSYSNLFVDIERFKALVAFRLDEGTRAMSTWGRGAENWLL